MSALLCIVHLVIEYDRARLPGNEAVTVYRGYALCARHFRENRNYFLAGSHDPEFPDLLPDGREPLRSPDGGKA